MEIKRAVITAAGKNQRTLPLQTLVDRDGAAKTALAIIIEEVLSAGIDEICVVVLPGDQAAYTTAAGKHANRLHFVEQPQPLGYGHAVYCARSFVGEDPFLLLLGDHVFISGSKKPCSRQVMDVYAQYETPISETLGRLSNLAIAPGFTSAASVVGNDLIAADRSGIQPRIGIAWRPVPGSSLVVRAGSILPMGPVLQHLSGPQARDVTLLTYPASNELVASCTLYDDDGTTNGYRQGDYSLTGFECSATAGALVCRIGATRGAAVPEGRTYAFQILAPARD